MDRISAENIPALTQVFGGLDEIEAYQYYEIVQERLMIIEKIACSMWKKNDREKVIQEYLYRSPYGCWIPHGTEQLKRRSWRRPCPKRV